MLVFFLTKLDDDKEMIREGIITKNIKFDFFFNFFFIKKLLLLLFVLIESCGFCLQTQCHPKHDQEKILTH